MENLECMGTVGFRKWGKVEKMWSLRKSVIPSYTLLPISWGWG